MAKDAIELLIQENNVKVKIEPGETHLFYISCNNMGPLIALVLKRKRLERGLTIMDVATRLGSKFPTAYARYEQGKNTPSLDKLDQILTAIDAKLEPILKIG